MAEMYTREEIDQISAAYNDAMEKNIPISKELAQQMKDATVGVKNYTQQLNQSLKQLGTSFLNLGSNIAKGEKGAAVYNDALSSGADAVSAYAAKFGPAGQALGLFAKATMAYVGAVNKQADALYKSYQDISRTGVVGAGGMKEVYANMQRFGYTINELGEFGTLMKSNSEVLAKFGGTAFNGAEQFAALADEIQQGEIGKRLMLMGVSVDEINKGAAGFLKQQTMMGRNSTSMQKTLAAETAKYLENLEAVSRLTGQSREQLEQKKQDALAEQQFAATRFQLKKKSDAGDEEATKQLHKLDMLNEVLEGEQRMNIIRAFGGDAAAAGNLFTAMPGVFEMLSDSGKDYADVLAKMGVNVERNANDMVEAYKYGHGQDTFGKFTEQQKLFAQIGGKSADEIRAMGEAALKNRETTDEATKGQVEIEKAQRKASNNMQDFLNLGINPATKAMQGLTYAVEYLTSFLPGTKKGKEAMARAEIAGNKMRGSSTQGSMNRSGGSGGAEDGNEEFDGSPSGGRPGTSTKGAEGLTLKPGAEKGGTSTETLYNMAQQVHKMLGGNYKYFSGLKDRGIDEGGAHPQGRAFDLVLNDPSQYAGVVAQMRALGGFSQVLDESQGPANPAQRDKWAPHIHAEVSAANGAILSGPRSGYQPNLTMHGTEAVVPLPDGRSIPVAGGADSSGMMSAQLDKLDELISVMKSQLSVSNKLLSYSS